VYQLTVSEEQAEVISKSVEFFARINMGQLEEVFYQLLDNPKFLDLSVDERQAFRSQLAEASLMFTKLTSGASFGIHNPDIPEQARTAWDVYQIIRQVLAWERQPTGGDSVNFGNPFKTGVEDLARMEKVSK